MGSRLTGQIKYMQMFMKQMHELLEDVQVGMYNGEPFDENSNSFNGGELFEDQKVRKRQNVNKQETSGAAAASHSEESAGNVQCWF